MRRSGAIILAAGASRRFGSAKQLQLWRGVSLFGRAVAAAIDGGCDPIVAVVGELEGELRQQLNDRPVELVPNPDWALGMGTSIRHGLQHLLGRRPDLLSVVCLTCDQPFVDGAIVRTLAEAAQIAGMDIAAARYANTLGIPAYFGRAHFPALQSLADDSGAKQIIISNLAGLVAVDFANGAVDIDTPAQLRSSLDRL